MGKVLINFTAKITPVKPVNDEFTLCKCFILALGKNYNKSIISKEAADDALPTLFNIPVVGHIYLDENGKSHMGGHDMKIVADDKGNYKFRVLTIPYGTIPYQDNVHYEEVEEKDGTVKTYLVADIILWTGRYPELLDTAYDKEIYFNQSMEINPIKTSKGEDNYTDIGKYTYSALCLLGKSDEAEDNVEPCFPSSRVEPYMFSRVENWDELVNEFTTKLRDCYEKSNAFGEGGKTLEKEQLQKILSEFGIEDIEHLPFSIAEDISEDELRSKLQETFASQNDGEENPVDEGEKKEDFQAAEPTTPEETEPSATDNGELKFQRTATYNERRENICKQLCSLNVRDGNIYKSYYLCDFDDSYIYAEMYAETAEGCESGYVRMSYTEDDNGISIDANSQTKVTLRFLTDEDISKLSEEKAEFDALKEFKAERLEDDKRKAYSAVISEFSDISAFEEYTAIVGNALTFESADALREKLYAIRGKHADELGSKSKTEDKPLPIDFSKNQEDDNKNKNGDNIPEYERKFFEKYAPKKNKN